MDHKLEWFLVLSGLRLVIMCVHVVVKQRARHMKNLNHLINRWCDTVLPVFVYKNEMFRKKLWPDFIQLFEWRLAK